MKIRIQPMAQKDLRNSYLFYESQGKGLGSYFIDSLFSDIDSLQLYAGIHSLHWGFHRMLSMRFPYAIYYLLDGETVKIFAVINCRMNPEKSLWKLKKRRVR